MNTLSQELILWILRLLPLWAIWKVLSWYWDKEVVNHLKGVRYELNLHNDLVKKGYFDGACRRCGK